MVEAGTQGVAAEMERGVDLRELHMVGQVQLGDRLDGDERERAWCPAF